MTTTIVKDAAGLTAALKAAHAGDVIKLAAGDYAAVSIKGLNFDGNVTITSLDPSNMATLNGLMVRASSGLTFQGLEFNVDPAKADYPFYVYQSKNIHFDGLDVHGSMDGSEANDIAALMIRMSSDVSVTNSEFQQLRHGIAHMDSKNLEISDNYFHDIRTDGIRGGGSSHVEISGNYFTNFHMSEGDHADAVQFWTTNTKVAATDIVVEGNVITRGDGDPIQGIFFRDQVGTLPFENVRIIDNLVVGGTFNGISANGAKDLLISGNTVVGLPDQMSRILVTNGDRIELVGNTATQYLLDGSTNVTQTGDVTIDSPTDGGKLIQAQWLQDHTSLLGSLSSVLSSTLKLIDGLLNVDALTVSILDAAAEAAVREMTATRTTAIEVTGTAGNDSLKVNTTQDTFVDAGAGNDIIYGGGIGHNTMSGGAGDDTYYVKSGFDQVLEGVNGGTDTVATTVDFTLSANVENLRLTGDAYLGVGNELANKISGTDGANEVRGMGGDDLIQVIGGDDRVSGGDGNDNIVGGEGDDVLSGDAGNDRLRGDDGNDSLDGGAGNDIVEGGSGADTMTGGAGADTFLYREGDLSLTPDRILDFNRAEGDKISLQSIDANASLTGDQKFVFIGNSAFHKTAGELRLDVSGGVNTLYGDTNGDGIADFSLVVLPVQTLQAGDFLL